MLQLKKDKYYYAIKIAATDKIVVNGVEVTMTAGTYWAHNEASLSRPSFYEMLIARLNTWSTGWIVEASTPSGSASRVGIKLSKPTSTAWTSINLAATSPIVKRLLGYDENDMSTNSITASMAAGPYSSYGFWSPWSLFEGRATSKDSHLERVTGWSTSHAEVATSIVWRERRYRLVKYEYVFGTYICTNRNEFDDLAEMARRPMGDVNNTLEQLWLISGRDISDIIACYDMDDLDLEVTSHPYEYLKIADQKSTEDMEAIAKQTQIAGDFWAVNIPFVYVGGGSYGL
jgi:hypothetical protein